MYRTILVESFSVISLISAASKNTSVIPKQRQWKSTALRTIVLLQHFKIIYVVLCQHLQALQDERLKGLL